MAVLIGHAVGDENGGGYNGQAGDQTGKEIRTQAWYNRSGGWGVYLECTDAALADKAAEFMERICASPHFGYDRTDRKTGYAAIKAVNLDVENAEDSEFDCSSLCYSCYIFAGLPLSRVGTTSTLKSDFLATGKFVAYTDVAHTGSADLAKRGGLYLTAGAHVAMVLTDGSAATESGTDAVDEETKFFSHALSYGCKCPDVAKLKALLIAAGYTGGVTASNESFGNSTRALVRKFQTARGLTVDGIAGKETLTALGGEWIGGAA